MTGARPIRHLLGLQDMPPDELRSLLVASLARRAEPDRARPLDGRTVANLFFEDSTRTRTSFSVAAMNLGAGVVDLLGSTLSVSKGETLIDTARNVEAMGVGAFVVRAAQGGSAAMIAGSVGVPVINAGDGKHEHPTQGLLDILTLAEAHRRTPSFDLSGLSVAIVGDVASSRVARSNIAGLTALGARVYCVGPAAMAPPSLASLGCEVRDELDPLLGEADAVMMLRIQFERHEGSKTPGPAGDAARSPAIASIREYRESFGLTRDRASRMKPGAVVMHPGPINRGIELDADVADGERSVIMRQVTNGVRVRMAVLAWALGT